jgi:hypothetical protein
MAVPAHRIEGSGDTAVFALHGVGSTGQAWSANIEQPAAFNAAVLRFLRKHFPR